MTVHGKSGPWMIIRNVRRKRVCSPTFPSPLLLCNNPKIPAIGICTRTKEMCSSSISVEDLSIILQEFKARPKIAQRKIGPNAFAEACKGLSRGINPSDENDFEAFGEQLKNENRGAVGEDHVQIGRNGTVLAISYVHHTRKKGRFKFSEKQWENLRGFLRLLSLAGFTSIHFWYDQCLWLRDSSKESWAHVGILPYAIWPVLSLGTKRETTDDRTIATETRYWPFVEEVTCLWGAGLFITNELRSADAEISNVRCNYTYNSREILAPQEALRMILLNIFHGAAENLTTGWQSDRKELHEMARKNVLYGGSTFYVGPDWKARLGTRPTNAKRLLDNLLLQDADVPPSTPLESDKIIDGLFLDGAKQIACDTRWGGILEFLSGNRFDDLSIVMNVEMKNAFENLSRFRVLVLPTNVEYQLLHICSDMRADCESTKSLWLLVKMNGDSIENDWSSNGNVEWWKVVHGKFCPRLRLALKNKNNSLVREVLAEQNRELGNYLGSASSQIDTQKENLKKLVWKCVPKKFQKTQIKKVQLKECRPKVELFIDEARTESTIPSEQNGVPFQNASCHDSTSVLNSKRASIKRKREKQQDSKTNDSIRWNNANNRKRHKLSNVEEESTEEFECTKDSQEEEESIEDHEFLKDSRDAQLTANSFEPNEQVRDEIGTSTSPYPETYDDLLAKVYAPHSCKPGPSRRQEEKLSKSIGTDLFHREINLDHVKRGAGEDERTSSHQHKQTELRQAFSIDFGCCTYKSGLQHDKNGKLESFSFDLTDGSETIHIVAFNEAALHWSSKVRMTRFYSIQKYSLKIPDIRWKRSTTFYEITLDMNSYLLEREKVSVPFHLKVRWNLTKIAALEKLDRIPCDFIGLVVKVHKLKKVVKRGSKKSMRNVIIVDDTYKFANLVLWGEHAKKVKVSDKKVHPVLLITNAISGSQNLSIDITPEVGLEVQPSYLAEADRLRDWSVNMINDGYKFNI